MAMCVRSKKIPGQFFQTAHQHYHRDLDALEYSYSFLQDLRPFYGIVIVKEVIPVIAEALAEHLSETRQSGRLDVQIREGRVALLTRPVVGRVLQRQKVRQGQVFLPQEQMMRPHQTYLSFLTSHQTAHHVHLPRR